MIDTLKPSYKIVTPIVRFIPNSWIMISASPQTHFGFINMATFLFKNNDISFQPFMWDTLYLIFVEIHLKLALFESAIDIFDERLKNLTFHHLFHSSRFSICGLKRWLKTIKSIHIKSFKSRNTKMRVETMKIKTNLLQK